MNIPIYEIAKLNGRAYFSEKARFLISQISNVFLITLFSFSIILLQNDLNLAQQSSKTIVEKYGQLRVEGNKIVNKDGNPIVLRGMSLFWSQWMGQFYNYNCIEWLRDDWKCTVVRAAMAVESGGYLSNKNTEKNKVKAVIDACIDLGIYVIVDWHDHNAQNHRAEAIEFFKEIADEYGDQPNLIYEIFNEPLNNVSWNNTVKPYADSVVQNIRLIDPDNLILVGSPTWSQDVDVASRSPLQYTNIAYTLHYYAATHKQFLRNKATTALNNGVALFVSEFGTCTSSGGGVIDFNESNTWFNFLENNKISWCNWSIADKDESSAALLVGANSEGGWTESQLSESGMFIRERIVTWNDSVFVAVQPDDLNELSVSFKLHQNYPNPFNPETKIVYELNKSGYVILDVYNVSGSKIKSITDGYKSHGKYTVTWDGSMESGGKASSGVYFFRIVFSQNDGISGNQKQVVKGILLK